MAGANELCLPIGITQRFFYLNDGTDIDQHVNINKVGYATCDGIGCGQSPTKTQYKENRCGVECSRKQIKYASVETPDYKI